MLFLAPRTEDRSGVGRDDDEAVSEEAAFSAAREAAEMAMLFISLRSGASWPGSAAVKALTAGLTMTPMLRTNDCWYGQT